MFVIIIIRILLMFSYYDCYAKIQLLLAVGGGERYELTQKGPG